MTCDRSTCSPAQGGVSTQTSFLDTSPCAPSSGIVDAAPRSAREQLQDGGPTCTCTRETFGCSIHPLGREEWIASQRASLAKMCRELVAGRGSMESAAASIVKSSASLTWFDRATCSWRTHQTSLTGASESFSETWPRAGTMVDGSCWALPMWALTMTDSAGSGSLKWPTPCAQYDDLSPQSWAKRSLKNKARNGTDATLSLATAAKMAEAGIDIRQSRRALREAAAKAPLIRGRLNPVWVAWLSGWPLDATASMQSATAKAPAKQPRRGAPSEAR